MRRSIRIPPGTAPLPSLQQRDVATLSSMPSSAAIIRSRRETRIYRFRPNSVQRDDFPHPLPKSPFLSPPFRSRDQPTIPAMTIARTAMHPRLRSNVCRRVYANGYGTCLRGRVCTRMYIHVCISVRGDHRTLQQLHQTSN